MRCSPAGDNVRPSRARRATPLAITRRHPRRTTAPQTAAVMIAGAVLIATVVGSAACSRAPGVRAPQSDGRGPTTAAAGSGVSVHLPRLAVPQHYALTITPALANATFSGEEQIEIRVAQPTTRIVLNAAEITVARAAIDAGGRRQVATVALDPAAETATLTVPAPVPSGPARLDIAYTGVLNDKLRGLYLSEANGRRYAVSQLEATDARRMFPSFDEPDFKATFDLTAIVGRGDTAISNGAVRADTPGPGPGQHTIAFATTPKMSTYLLALVVGNFECTSGAADGIPIRVCATADKKPLTTLALQAAENVLRFYDRYFAIKYPYGKLDVVAVPDFAAGAMENTAAIFYRETMLLADPARASLATRQQIMEVLAHEMAHQWFGDLVTMAWWNDIWLNEGFATWMETKPLKALEPGWHADLSEVRSNLAAINVDRLRSTRPVRNPADTPQQISEAFDDIAYDKGAAILRMIEGYVGEEPFRRGINAYLEKYEYANATAQDFWTTVAQSTGKPVDRVMGTFVTEPGVPFLSVRVSCDGGATTLGLTQERYQALGVSMPNARETWQIPVCVRAGASSKTACQLLTSASAAVKVPGCQPWALANGGGRGYYVSSYDPASLGRLEQALPALAEPERLMLAADVWSGVRAGRTDASDYLRLVRSLSFDRTSGVLRSLVDAMRAIDDNLVPADHLDRYRAWVRSVFGPILQQVGWQAAAGEPDDRRAVRAIAVRAMGEIGRDPDVITRARALVDRHPDPTLLDAVVAVAAANGDASLYDRYLARYRSATTPEDRDRFLFALARFPVPALVARTIDLALSPDVRTQDAGLLLEAVLDAPRGAARAWPLIERRWSEIATRLDPFFGFSEVVTGTGSLCDAAAADEVQAFFAAHPAPGAARTIQQAVDRIHSCVALAAGQRAKLGAWLDTQNTNGTIAAVRRR